MKLPMHRVSGFGHSSLRYKSARSASVVVKVLLVVAILGVLIALLFPATRHSGEAANRNSCQNNLKQIGLALLNYADKHGALPPAYTTDVNGKPLHSWRTLMLPDLEESALYASIDQTKPWDDPVHADAVKTRVPGYICPSYGRDDVRTTYLAVVTPDSAMRANEPRKLSDLPGGGRNTILVIEVPDEQAVAWMSPLDADEKLVKGLGPKSQSSHGAGFNALFADGHVQYISFDEMPEAEFRALISVPRKGQATAESGN